MVFFFNIKILDRVSVLILIVGITSFLYILHKFDIALHTNLGQKVKKSWLGKGTSLGFEIVGAEC